MKRLLIGLGILTIVALIVTYIALQWTGLFFLARHPNLDPTTRGDLLDYEEIETVTTDDIEDVFPEGEIAVTFDYDVTLYRVYYSSVYSSTPIVLSGLVMIPDANEALPHYQYHHGTMLPIPLESGEGRFDPPSFYEGGEPLPFANHYETRYLGLLPAAQGYFVSLPDYAGYAVSDDVEHPYTYHPELANYSVDMLLAAQALAEELGISLTDNLFLAGWSEGGGAALATHKLITEDYANELTVTASAPFAGPYDMTQFYRSIAQKEEAEEMAIYNWAVYSHNLFSGVERDAEEIWTYEVEDQLTALNLPANAPEDIFQPAQLDAMLNQTDEDLLTIIETVNLHEDWQPEGIVFLHSGRSDDVVPHFNTLSAYEGLRAAGGNVRLYEYDGDHESPLFDYLTQMLADFDVLR